MEWVFRSPIDLPQNRHLDSVVQVLWSQAALFGRGPVHRLQRVVCLSLSMQLWYLMADSLRLTSMRSVVILASWVALLWGCSPPTDSPSSSTWTELTAPWEWSAEGDTAETASGSDTSTVDSGGKGASKDTSPSDTSAGVSTGGDSGSGSSDTGTDSGDIDTGTKDKGGEDSGAGDTGSEDTGTDPPCETD